MPHLRKPLAVAAALNAGVLALEVACGISSSSLGLLADAAHNLSDETALACLLLAYSVRAGLSGNFLRLANLLNSVGILVIATGVVWQAAHRLVHPPPVAGVVVVAAALASALGNWAVTWVLRAASTDDASIRMAYVHNMGDALVSLVPALGGLCIVLVGATLVDAAVALLIAGILVISTLRVLGDVRTRLLWPDRVVCGSAPRAPGTIPL
jgi:cobalt-zinc-cadmium efflux system protein